MIQRILVLLIFLSPLLMHAQDTKTTIKADTIKAIKQADNFGNGNKNYRSNDDSPKNLIKAFAFTLFSSESALGIVTLGYERKLSNSISCELVGSFSKVGSTSTTEVLAIRPAVKYYYTEDHKTYVSLFLRYQKNKYKSSEGPNPDYTVTGYGIGGMLGGVIDITRVFKLDLGVGAFYSYRDPTPRKADDISVFIKGLYILPRIHLAVCF